MSSTFAGRVKIAQDTLARTPEVIAATAGASDRSHFIKEQLPPLDSSHCPNPGSSTTVHVVGTDSFTAARDIMRKDPTAHGKTAVLNLASDEARAGGWAHSYSRTQEEALCYSSTLYATLKESYYPWPNLGPGSVAGVFSPDVVIFKDDLDHDCADLPVKERRLVSVITVAAPRHPKLTPDREHFAKEEDLVNLRGKIRLVYRMAATYEKTNIVLGAMGCGAYGCPPRMVAEEMKNILLEDEFKGWFKSIIFAVYKTNSGSHGPAVNYDIFKEVFDGLKV